MDLLVSFYIYLGYNAKYFNTTLRTFILNNNYCGNSIINLHFTWAFTKLALQYCCNLIIKNNFVIFISATKYFSKKKDISSLKNIQFWFDKWPRGALSGYKTSSARYFFKFPNFIVFLDSGAIGKQPISDEANKVGIFSFGFVDTQSNLNKMSYWALGNTRSIISKNFYFDLIKSIFIKSKFIKAQKFLNK